MPTKSIRNHETLSQQITISPGDLIQERFQTNDGQTSDLYGKVTRLDKTTSSVTIEYALKNGRRVSTLPVTGIVRDMASLNTIEAENTGTNFRRRVENRDLPKEIRNRF